MDVGAGRDRPGGKTDDLAVLPDRIPLGDVAKRHLVPQADGLANLDGTISENEDQPLGNGPRGHRHVVVASEQDRLGRLGRQLPFEGSSS